MSHWLITPWKWKSRWIWLTGIIVVLPAVYCLSAEPVCYFASRNGMSMSARFAIFRFYLPARWCGKSSAVSRVMNWERDMMIKTFGPPHKHKQVTSLPKPVP